MNKKFLHPYTRKEAFAKGISFNNKAKHEVLQQADFFSTLKKAKNGELLKNENIHSLLDGKVNESAIDKILIELKLDNMITTLPGLEFDRSEEKLVPVLYLVSLPEKRPSGLADVYEACLDQSTKEVRSYMESVEWFDRESFWKDLDSSLMEDNSTDVFYPHIVFDIKSIFHKLNVPFSINPDIINDYKLDFSSRLLANQIGIDIGDNKVFLHTEADLPEIAKALSSFFRNRIFPCYSELPEVRREIEVIDQQEELYNSDPQNHKTFAYSEARARVVYNYLSRDAYKDQAIFPSRLPLLMICKLEEKINEVYEKEHIEAVFAQYREIKAQLSSESSWRELVLFLTDDDLKSYYLQSIDKLKKDKEILYTVWFTGDQAYHVFMKLNVDYFNTVVNGMKALTNKEAWKVLAVRKLLENSTKLKPELNPFYSHSFSAKYGKLIKAAYSVHMPFLYNFVLSFKIRFLDKLIFQSVKRKVYDQQQVLKSKYKVWKELLQQNSAETVGLKNAYIKRLITRNRILEELDFFYFRQNSIPSVHDITARFPNINEAAFKQFLKEFEFELISVRGNDSWRDKIIFYPKSASWKYLAQKTAEKVNEMIESHKHLAKYGESDPVALDRLKAVKHKIQSETLSFGE
ncbi:MAG: hypothetical protein ABUK01_18725 [Leptospirales bacterium]